jgi:transposase
MTRQYIGVDLHKAFFQACAITATGERAWEGRFARTPDGIARFLARGIDLGHAVAVEASGPTWAFVDALVPTGAAVCVVDPRKTKLKAGFAAKTDRLDARRLADALRRESVVSIYIPAPPIRELREVCRGRHQVVRLRTRLAQMIRALLLRSDAGEPPGTRLFAPRALAWLAAVRLRPDAERQLRRLERLYCEIHRDAIAADTEVKQRAAADPIAVALASLTGLGPVLARGGRRYHTLCEWARVGQLRRAGAARRPECGPRLSRTHHEGGVAVAALGPRRRGDARDETNGCDRPVGAATRGAQRRLQSARRAGTSAL